MFRSSAIALSFVVITVFAGVQAVSAQTGQSRIAKPFHARTAAPPNKTALPHGPTQDEKNWMDRASAQSNGGGGGGGGGM